VSCPMTYSLTNQETFMSPRHLKCLYAYILLFMLMYFFSSPMRYMTSYNGPCADTFSHILMFAVDLRSRILHAFKDI